MCKGILLCGVLLFAVARGASAAYRLSPVPLRDVEITDEFWTPRIEKNRAVSLPRLLDRMEQRRGFADGRLIEAAAYVLSKRQDQALQLRMERMFDRMVESMRARKGVWANRGDGPFFAVGHFFEGAVAYYEATGNRKLLDAAIEIADDIDRVFGPNKRYDISNHEGIKIGLVKLYRATGNERYLALARFLLDVRGTRQGGRELFGPYAQDHEPVAQQTRAIGHVVRATYLYNALTDLAALTGDSAYALANERIWADAVSKRTYLTGGIGTYRHEEDYGDEYDLPNLACWNEICAAVGSTLWNHRMFLMHADAKYIDVMERTLYNGLLTGVSLDGEKYLYQAPLKAYEGFGRETAFGPNCCPPNITRLLGELGGLIYAHDDQALYVNLFVGSRAKVLLKQIPFAISQETKYPWDGSTRLTVRLPGPLKYSMLLRVPGWLRNEAMPGGLYRFARDASRPAGNLDFSVSVNGKPFPHTVEKGYVRIDRQWADGDVVDFRFPMPVQRVQADDRVADDRGMIALQRGPIVFCAEGVDNSPTLFNIVVPDNAPLRFVYRPDLLGGIGTVTGRVVRVDRAKGAGPASKQQHDLQAIPYYAFGNRGRTRMAVWLARAESRAELPPRPTIASMSKATSSSGNGTVAENYPGGNPPGVAQRFYPNSQDGSGDIRAIYDQLEPVNSEDGSAPFLRLRPQAGDRAWVQYEFAAPAKVSSVSVYWKDDKQYCVLPKSWRLLYKDGAEWKPVRALVAYGVERDQYNRVTFSPLTTSGLKMEIELQPKVYRKGKLGPPDGNYLEQDLTWYEGGVIEWRVNE